MKRNMGNTYKWECLMQMTGIRQTMDVLNLIPIKVSVMPISFGWNPISPLSLGTFSSLIYCTLLNRLLHALELLSFRSLEIIPFITLMQTYIFFINLICCISNFPYLLIIHIFFLKSIVTLPKHCNSLICTHIKEIMYKYLICNYDS